MRTYVISNKSQSIIIAKDFETATDAVTWCQNTQDMSQEWNVDSLRYIVATAYREV